jgi:hypothetical protein
MPRLGDNLFNGVGNQLAFFGLGAGGMAVQDEGAQAPAGFHQSLAFEPLIDLGDSEEVDLEIGREIADGGHLLIRGQLARDDALAQLLEELAVDGPAAVRIEMQEHSVLQHYYTKARKAQGKSFLRCEIEFGLVSPYRVRDLADRAIGNCSLRICYLSFSSEAG